MNPVAQLQLVQQNLSHITAQRQQWETTMHEVSSAITELSSAEKSYRIIGKIMVSTSKEMLLTELKDQQEQGKIRLKNFLQQEEKLQQQLEQVQQDVVKSYNE